MKNRTSMPRQLPKRWYVYMGITILGIFLFGFNVYRTDDWMGEKPLWEYTSRDLTRLKIFFIEELIILAMIIVFMCLALGASKKRQGERTEFFYEHTLMAGIKPGDYDDVWVDFSDSARALILRQGDAFRLYVEEYDERTDDWKSINTASVYESLDDIKKTLFYEYDFYCVANAVLDEHGNEVYKED